MRTYTFDLEPGNRVFAWCWRGKDDVVFTSEFLTESDIDYRVVVEYDASLYLLLHILEDWVMVPYGYYIAVYSDKDVFILSPDYFDNF